MVDKSLPTGSYADLQGLDQLKLKAKKNDPQALEAVAKQFESLFLNMLLKNMRQANESFSEGGLFDSSQSKFYQQMLDQEMSVSLSSGKGIGVSEMLVRQLSPKSAYRSEPSTDVTRVDFDRALDRTARSAVEAMIRQQQGGETAPGQAPVALPAETLAAQRDGARRNAAEPGVAQSGGPQPAPRPAVTQARAEAAPEPDFSSPEAFVRTLTPAAQRVAGELGVDPKVLIAQSALETGWGRHLPRKPDGSSSYNLFGIKADERWQGESVQVGTLEYRDGAARREQARFRAYSSFEESLRDYADFIASSPRYQGALAEAGDGERYLQQLQRAGYATDPDYARKITGIMGSELLLTALVDTKDSEA